MNVKAHYENHLGNFYEWMAGDFEATVKQQQEFFEQNNILPKGNKIAVELGCGHGIHSVALAKAGFSVKAIDFNEQLLHSLKNHTHELDIEIIHADFLAFRKYINKAALVVCMGDTIAHLESTKQLQNLFRNIYETLDKNGNMVISYRDYSHILKDTERFIPVKADDTRILTCVLEYFDNKVRVTDLLHERENGTWKQKASSYMKLRLRNNEVEEMVKEAGLAIKSATVQNRMHYLVATKPS